MRICIWYELTARPWGGSNSFLSTLSKEFRRLGITIDHSPTNKDEIVLVNSWSRGKGHYMDVEKVSRIKSAVTPAEKIPLIQRLDGIARLYGRDDPLADQIQCSIARLADGVIFQSQYSLQSFAEYGIRPKESVVIHNAVDGNVFYPIADRHLPGKQIKVVAVSWSNNLLKGFSFLPVLASLDNVKVYFIGNWNSTIHQGNVSCLGVKSKKEIAVILREMDLLVHPAVNDPCSNVIIEGLASGLPVLFHDSGGNTELASDYGLPISKRPGDSLQEIQGRYSELREKIMEHREKFLIQDCAKKYLSMFEKLIAST